MYEEMQLRMEVVKESGSRKCNRAGQRNLLKPPLLSSQQFPFDQPGRNFIVEHFFGDFRQIFSFTVDLRQSLANLKRGLLFFLNLESGNLSAAKIYVHPKWPLFL